MTGLIISSCDKKNASFVNRRTATHEKIGKTKEAQPAKAKKEERLTVTPLKSEQVSETTKEKEEPKQESTDSVVIQPQHQSPPSLLAPPQTPVVDNVIAVVDDHGSSSVPRLAQSEVLSSQEQVPEPTKEKEEPKQESTDSVVIQPQHQSPPSLLAPPQTPVVDNVIAVVDDHGSSSVPRLAQSEVLSSQEQVPEPTKDKDPAPIPEPVTNPSPVPKPDSEPEFVVKLVDYIPPVKSETIPELSLTPEAAETNEEYWQAYRDLEELSDKDKAIKAQIQNKEFENFERLLEETEEEEAERSKMEKQMKEVDEQQRERFRFGEEEQMRNLEFAAMQKAEAEQKARLEERAKIWADYLARYPEVDYTANPIEGEKLADYWYKREQETKREIEKSARDREKGKETVRQILNLRREADRQERILREREKRERERKRD